MTARAIRLHAAFGVVLMGAAVFSFAQSLDAAKSHIAFHSTQMNVPVEGQFGKFTAQIAWNAAKPETSHAEVTVDVTSFDIGLDYVNEEAKGKDWFDAKTFPQAKFVSTAVKAISGGRFEAVGKLTIKGATRDVVAAFAVKPEGSGFSFEGSLPIKRLQFKVGEGQWGDTGTVADEVQIRFRIVTAAAQAPKRK